MAEYSTDDLPQFAAEIAKSLCQRPFFCLWLSGDLGAGKTTLTGHILRALGLPAKIPVTSPTFTYFNDYDVNGDWFAHMDLYRAGEDFSLEEIGIADLGHYRGFFIEWPEQIPESPLIEPTHTLKISLTDEANVRSFDFAPL